MLCLHSLKFSRIFSTLNGVKLEITCNIVTITFTRPLTSLACHGVRMYVRF